MSHHQKSVNLSLVYEGEIKLHFSYCPKMCEITSFTKRGAFRLRAFWSCMTAMAVVSDFHRTFLPQFTPFGMKPLRIVFCCEKYSTAVGVCQRFAKIRPHFTWEKQEFTKKRKENSFRLGMLIRARSALRPKHPRYRRAGG